jgi:starvation-inducible outer membrane lipoprotein
MDRMNHLPVMLVLLTMMAVTVGCNRHVLSDQALSAVDLPGGYEQFIRNPPAHVGETVLLGGMITEYGVTREGTTLKVKPYTLDSQGLPRQLIQDGEEFLARTDNLLPPDKFGAGHMVTMTGTYQGLATKEQAEKAYRPMLFEIRTIRSWPRPAIYPYGYHYPFRIY